MSDFKHSIVYYEPQAWAAVPANNGGNGPTYQWSNELLVGFNRGVGRFDVEGHQCSYDYPFESWLARSLDGGETWQAYKPESYIGCDMPIMPLAEPIDITSSGFVMRIEGNGYHGNQGAQWYVSMDKGATWQGAYSFGALLEHPELADKQFTSRTAWWVRGVDDLRVFMSARQQLNGGNLNIYDAEKPFMARSRDGGMTFEFVSWLVPWENPYRAVMPAPVYLWDGLWVAALRRRSPKHNWLAVVASRNDGVTWAFQSKAVYTEEGNRFNGNPPSMIQLQDGRLCLAYGNRSRCQIEAVYSDDAGLTWSEPQVIRDGFQSVNGWPDLGYVRLFQRMDSKCVAVYFWCSPERPQTHIAATIFAVNR